MRPDWEQVRLRYLAEIDPSKREVSSLPGSTEVSFVPMEAVDFGKPPDVSETRELGDVLEGYTYFAEGDVLLAKISPTFQNGKCGIARGLTNGIGFGTTELVVLRPNKRIDRRFLLYLIRSADFTQGGEARLYGVAGQKRIPIDYLRDFAVSLPPLGEQRRIANYLDEQTARMDTLVEKNLHLGALAEERYQSFAASVYNEADERVPLKYLVAHRPSYGVLKPERQDEGVRLIRIEDVTDEGDVDLIGCARIPEAQHKEYIRTELSVGDVVVSVVGTIGRSFVVEPEAAGANLSRALARIEPDGVPSDWLARWIRSEDFDSQVDRIATGTAQRVLNMEDLVELKVPVFGGNRHGSAEGRLATAARWLSQVRQTLEEQLGLLAERRRALIAAAVTGEIDVTTAGRAA